MNLLQQRYPNMRNDPSNRSSAPRPWYRCAGTYQVFLQLGQHLGEDQLVVGLETMQLGEPWDEEP